MEINKDGVTGYGEAAPNVRYGETAEMTEKVIQRVSETLANQDLFDYAQVKLLLDELIVGQNCAKAALDMAVMDWAGTSQGRPLYEMIGADPSKAGVTSFTIGIDEPGMIKTKVLDASDYPILKIKLGGDNDEEIINAVRSVTDNPIRVDANEGWRDKETAVKKIEWLGAKGVEFVEQPMPAERLEETAWVRQRVDMPLIADEDVIDAKDIGPLAKVYDGINIKLMKSGGIQEAMKMIEAARAGSLKIMIGCMIESSVAISAAAALSPLADWGDLDGNLLISNDPFSGVKVSEGRLILSDEAGIGVLNQKSKRQIKN